MVSLTPKAGQHYYVVCSGCTYATAEFCGKRDTPAIACRKAIDAFRKAGWHVDGLGTERERWYCPGCAKRKHL